jgi:hypothetical protein
MKTVSAIVVLLVAGFFTSCEHRLDSRTIVYPDGRLERTFIRESKDSTGVSPDYLGLTNASGWQMDTPRHLSKERYEIKQHKTFASAEASNQELDGDTRDSLLRIHCQFQKKFRWFYTYYEYTETLKAINRFSLPVTEYLTDQDFEFINQLPAEGKAISQADSLFLESLRERIYDGYVMRAYFESFFALLLAEEKDPLRRAAQQEKREVAFQLLKGDSLANDQDFLRVLATRIGVDTTVLNRPSFVQKNQLLEGQISFMAWSADGKFHHQIEMPGTLMATNADTVDNGVLEWSPPALKFHFRDFTMQATSRQPNYWAWGVSIVLGAVAIFIRVRRKK